MLTTTLNFEDLDALNGGLLADLIRSRVEAVCANKVTLRVSFDHWSDPDAHAIVQVLHGVHRRVLSIKGCEKKARCQLNIDQLIHDLILGLQLLFFFDRPHDSSLIYLLRHELIVLARQVAKIGHDGHDCIVIGLHANFSQISKLFDTN